MNYLNEELTNLENQLKTTKTSDSGTQTKNIKKVNRLTQTDELVDLNSRKSSTEKGLKIKNDSENNISNQNIPSFAAIPKP